MAAFDILALVSRLSGELEKQAVARFCFMEEQKIKKSLAPRVWDALADNLRKQAKRIGEVSPVDLLAERRSAYELRLTNRNSGRRVKLNYDPDVPCIHFEGFEGGGYFAFKVNPDGTQVQLFDVKRNIPVSIEDVAFDIVRTLTGQP